MSYLTLPDYKEYSWLTRFFYKYLNKRNKFPEPLRFWSRSPLTMLGFLLMLKGLKNDHGKVSMELQALVRTFIAKKYICSFCIDLNQSEAQKIGISFDKLEAVMNYSNSNLFSKLEKNVFKYIECVINTDTSTENAINELKQNLTDREITILTQIVTHQAMSAQFNSALGISPAGYCSIPSSVESKKQ